MELLHEARVYQMESVALKLSDILKMNSRLEVALKDSQSLDLDAFRILSASIIFAFEHESANGLKLFLVKKLADFVCKAVNIYGGTPPDYTLLFPT